MWFSKSRIAGILCLLVISAIGTASRASYPGSILVDKYQADGSMPGRDAGGGGAGGGRPPALFPRSPVFFHAHRQGVVFLPPFGPGA
jgi:hypothetical protein